MDAITALVPIVWIKGRVSFQRCLFVIFLLMLNSEVQCFLVVAEGWKMGGKKQGALCSGNTVWSLQA